MPPCTQTISQQTSHLQVVSISHQPGHPPLPSRFCVRPRSLSAFDCQLLTSSSSTFQCAGRLPRLPRLPRPCRGLCRGTSRAPGPGVGACPACLSRLGRGLDFVGEFLEALDSSSLGLTLNLQSEVRRLSRPEIPTRSGLSTFNCLSFLSPSSPHLCALCVLCGENSLSFPSCPIPRHSPLTTNSFRIRTSKTPLPQLLYNPHLRAPFGSAGNKGLITPLESALTRNSPVTPVESALAETWGVGCPLPFARPPFFLPRYVVTCNRIQVLSFQTHPHSFAFAQNATLLFSIDSALFAQNTQGVVSIMVPSPKKNFDFPAPRYSPGRGGWDYSLREKEIVDSTES